VGRTLLSVAVDVASDFAFAAAPTTSNFSLDNRVRVTVRLHIMRNRSVTYSSEATFQALADPTRRAVLDLLRRGSQPAGEIAQAFPVSRPAISKHLRLLRRAHLVREHREGRHRVYQLNPEPLRAVDSWIDQYRNFWKLNLANLKTFVEAEYAKESNQSHASKPDTKTPKGDR
jgi:DNA-binding transcriptional ArsR family regulator